MNNHDNNAKSRGMRAKTIKAVLRRKTDEWLATIEDEPLRRDCAKEAIITGGCIASMLLGEAVNDFDVYFRAKSTVKRVAEYYVKEFAKNTPGISCEVEELKDLAGTDRIRIVVSSEGVASADGNLIGDDEDGLGPDENAPEGAGYLPVFLSSNAISLRGKIQLILRFYGDPDEIHGSYDFAHCMNYWESGSSTLTLRPAALEALLSRTLQYHGSKYPLCSVIRSRKFIERGWRITAGQYLKMAMQISDLDMTNPAVLEEQLTGVDAAYFVQIISALKEKDPERVDPTYLAELIDRLF